MKRTFLLFVQIGAALLPVAAQEPTYTNSIGMEFVLIHPGSMQVGVYQPYCPDPTKPLPPYIAAFPYGGGAGARGGAPAAGALTSGSGAAAGTPGRPGGPPPDPRVLWTEADVKRCNELAR